MRRVCEACGSEIDNDFNYCRECGEIVEPVEEDQDEEDLIIVERKKKMTKEQFLKKHELNEQDYKNLIRYEEAKLVGKMNMFEYLSFMEEFNVNGGIRLARWILTGDNYFDFLETLEEGK